MMRNIRVRSYSLLLSLLLLLLSVPFVSHAAGTVFSDVPGTAWYYESVMYCADKSLVNGVGDGKFAPNASLTRAMFVTILGRYAGAAEQVSETGFSDVKAGAWYAPYVCWAKEVGVTDGTGGGLFSPDASITREQLSAMIARYLAFVGEPLSGGGTGTLFKDEKEISTYARESVYGCAAESIMTGVGNGMFAPKKTATRAEICTVVKRVIQYLEKRKTADIYLIAGQSNAAGYTYWNFYTEEVSKELEEHPEYFGFQNVYYSGSTSEITSFLRLSPVELGQGRDDNQFGPEVGMASVLEAVYANTPHKDACIIKYAVGGTSLENRDPYVYNWSSPTMISAMRAKEITDKTGLLYRNLLEVVRGARQLLIRRGYKRIVVKGLYWMQGEDDIGYEEHYYREFPIFAADLRGDLSTVFEQDLSAMPILIGEISESFGGESRRAKCAAFVAMQDTLPDVVPNCTVVKNGKIPVGGIGGDSAHWGFFDMLAIGRTVGNTFLTVAP